MQFAAIQVALLKGAGMPSTIIEMYAYARIQTRLVVATLSILIIFTVIDTRTNRKELFKLKPDSNIGHGWNGMAKTAARFS